MVQHWICCLSCFHNTQNLKKYLIINCVLTSPDLDAISTINYMNETNLTTHRPRLSIPTRIHYTWTNIRGQLNLQTWGNVTRTSSKNFLASSPSASLSLMTIEAIPLSPRSINKWEKSNFSQNSTLYTWKTVMLFQKEINLTSLEATESTFNSGYYQKYF
jgi:hypothetical protein